MKKNVLVIGAGAVAHVVVHKAAQHNDVLGDICVASRTLSKCDAIIASVHQRHMLKDPGLRLHSRQVNATEVPALVALIRETGSQIVVNVGQTYLNMAVMKACIEAGVAYLDTGSYDEPDDPDCDLPPRFQNFEWTLKPECERRGITAILGAGFDPGVTNAYCAHAARHLFDEIESIDILDVNAGNHGRYFATNFDPEINFREFTRVFSWVERQWVRDEIHSVKRVYDFPRVGPLPVYLTAHDEVHSLWHTLKVPTVRFWMGFGEHYINVFNVLTRLGLTSIEPVRTAEGVEVVPLKVLKAVLPDPQSLAANYRGQTCIGCLIKGRENGAPTQAFIYNVCSHEASFAEMGSQAISYTAGVPAVAAAMLVARGVWDPRTQAHVEELDPDPFLDLVGSLGLPTEFAQGIEQLETQRRAT
jgi:saccharopine dehydrogenase-like NADP-dependent oxidoreductase